MIESIYTETNERMGKTISALENDISASYISEQKAFCFQKSFMFSLYKWLKNQDVRKSALS